MITDSNRSLANNCSATYIKGIKCSVDETETVTCISKNIVYSIICKRCHMIYIGETGRRLVDVIPNDICNIINNFSCFPAAQHVNPPPRCSLNGFYMTGIIHCNCSHENGISIEKGITFKFGTYLPSDLPQKLTRYPLRNL